MRRIRVIPTLLISNNRLVKTIKFKKETYIGDPINAIKIFNDKEVDELVVLDIRSTRDNIPPNYALIEQFASECFMPLAYGGGISSLDQVHKVFGLGVEKIIINSAALTNDLITSAAAFYGSQSIVASIDVDKSVFGKYVVSTIGGTHKLKTSPVDYARELEKRGAGEIILNSIFKDGLMTGYDYKLIHSISESVNIPVVACGGAGSISDLKDAIVIGKASAVAAGSMFVYNGKHKAVLINYPNQEKLVQEFFKQVTS